MTIAARIVTLDYDHALFVRHALEVFKAGGRVRVAGERRHTIYTRLADNNIYCSVVDDHAGGWIVSFRSQVGEPRPMATVTKKLIKLKHKNRRQKS